MKSPGFHRYRWTVLRWWESGDGFIPSPTLPGRMNGRALPLALASAVTTFLLAGAVTLLVLGDLYGESPGVGILGVAVGAVAAIAAAVAVGLAADRLLGRSAAALVAYGTFGVAFLVVAGARYVNVPGADAVTFPVHVAVSLVVALLAAALAGRERPSNGTADG